VLPRAPGDRGRARGGTQIGADLRRP
jgi:hypothetical protein